MKTELESPADGLPALEASNRNGAEHQAKVDAHFELHSTGWRDVYHDNGVEGAIYRKRLEIILEWIDKLATPAGEKALEIGCGGGRMTVALAQRGYNVSAIDSAANMLAITRQHAANMKVSEFISTNLGDAHALNFPNQTFALVVAVGVAPYLHSPRNALAEMARVVRPDGFVLVTAGNRWRLGHLVDPWLFPAIQPMRTVLGKLLRRPEKSHSSSKWPPIRFDSIRDMDRWLSNAGLTRIKTTTVGFPAPTVFERMIVGSRLAIKLNESLQRLVDHDVPGIKWAGMDYVVLAKKLAG